MTSIFLDTNIDKALANEKDVTLSMEDKVYLSGASTLYALGVTDLSFLPCEVFSKETIMMRTAKSVIRFEGYLFDEDGNYLNQAESVKTKEFRRDFEREWEQKLVVASKAIRHARERGGLREKESLGQLIADEAEAMGLTKKSGRPFSCRTCDDWKRTYLSLSPHERERIDRISLEQE